MKTNSSVKPSTIIKSQGLIYLVDMSSVVETVIETEVVSDGLENPEVSKQTSFSYSYDMYPLQISDRPNLIDYVEANYTVLLDFAINNYINSLVRPSDEEVKKAEQELEIINLMTDLGVL